MDEIETLAMWDRFWDGDASAREPLILRYMPLVHYVARRVGKKLPASVDVDDLVSTGVFGLIDAIDKFDASLGFKFETYAFKRIRGAILDDLRRMDWVPRTVRSLAKELDAAENDFLAMNHRNPNDAELEQSLGWEDGKLQRVRSQLNDANLESLEKTNGPLGLADFASQGNMHGVLADTGFQPDRMLEIQELKGSITEAISSLAEREMAILTLYYFEKMKFSEIGALFQVSESRICQIHMDAIDQLRDSLI